MTATERAAIARRNQQAAARRLAARNSGATSARVPRVSPDDYRDTFRLLHWTNGQGRADTTIDPE